MPWVPCKMSRKLQPVLSTIICKNRKPALMPQLRYILIIHRLLFMKKLHIPSVFHRVLSRKKGTAFIHQLLEAFISQSFESLRRDCSCLPRLANCQEMTQSYPRRIAILQLGAGDLPIWSPSPWGRGTSALPPQTRWCPLTRK